MPANVYKKVATICSTVSTIIISRNADKYDFRNAGNYSFRNAGNHTCPKNLPSLFLELLAIIIARTADSYILFEILAIIISEMLTILFFRKVCDTC